MNAGFEPGHAGGRRLFVLFSAGFVAHTHMLPPPPMHPALVPAVTHVHVLPRNKRCIGISGSKVVRGTLLYILHMHVACMQRSDGENSTYTLT